MRTSGSGHKAVANGALAVEPYTWLRRVLRDLPSAKTVEDVEAAEERAWSAHTALDLIHLQHRGFYAAQRYSPSPRVSSQ